MNAIIPVGYNMVIIYYIHTFNRHLYGLEWTEIRVRRPRRTRFNSKWLVHNDIVFRMVNSTYTPRIPIQLRLCNVRNYSLERYRSSSADSLYYDDRHSASSKYLFSSPTPVFESHNIFNVSNWRPTPVENAILYYNNVYYIIRDNTIMLPCAVCVYVCENNFQIGF